MTPKEFAHATMLVASLRTRLGHANALTAAVTAERDDLAKQLAAHVESLTLSNAQCADYHKRIERLADDLTAGNAERDTLHNYAEKLHSELVEVRAALARVSAERDSLTRTLKEWEEAETKPQQRVAADDIADHVVPPVLPLCGICHECGSKLGAWGPGLRCHNQLCNRTATGALCLELSPFHGPCTSPHQVRHE